MSTNLIRNIIPDDAWILSPNKDMCYNVHFKDKSTALECAQCVQLFSQIVRKHHCRGCGNVFCADCAKVYKFSGQKDAQGMAKIRCCYDCKDRVEAQHQPTTRRRKSTAAKRSQSWKVIQSGKQPVLELLDDEDGYNSDTTIRATKAVEFADLTPETIKTRPFSVSRNDTDVIETISPLIQMAAISTEDAGTSKPAPSNDLNSCLDKENMCNSPVWKNDTQKLSPLPHRPLSARIFNIPSRSSIEQHPLDGVAAMKPATKVEPVPRARPPLPPTIMSPAGLPPTLRSATPASIQSDEGSFSSPGSAESDDARNSMGFLCFMSPAVYQLFRGGKSRIR